MKGKFSTSSLSSLCAFLPCLLWFSSISSVAADVDAKTGLSYSRNKCPTVVPYTDTNGDVPNNAPDKQQGVQGSSAVNWADYNTFVEKLFTDSQYTSFIGTCVEDDAQQGSTTLFTDAASYNQVYLINGISMEFYISYTTHMTGDACKEINQWHPAGKDYKSGKLYKRFLMIAKSTPGFVGLFDGTSLTPKDPKNDKFSSSSKIIYGGYLEDYDDKGNKMWELKVYFKQLPGGLPGSKEKRDVEVSRIPHKFRPA